MPSIKDKSTVKAIARVFCGEGKRNKEQTLKAIGYKPGYYKSGRSVAVVYGNERVKKAIAHIDRESQFKSDYDLETAIKGLKTRLEYVSKQAEKGNIAAVNCQAGLLRELHDICGLHKQRFVDETDEAKRLEDSKKAEANRLANIRLREIGA